MSGLDLHTLQPSLKILMGLLSHFRNDGGDGLVTWVVWALKFVDLEVICWQWYLPMSVDTCRSLIYNLTIYMLDSAMCFQHDTYHFFPTKKADPLSVVCFMLFEEAHSRNRESEEPERKLI
jgi:hypothetical protein